MPEQVQRYGMAWTEGKVTTMVLFTGQLMHTASPGFVQRFSFAVVALWALRLAPGAGAQPRHHGPPEARAVFAQTGGAAGSAPLPEASPAFFTSDVRPILHEHCGRCHEGSAHRGGLNMDTRAALLKGGHHGPAVVPGDPAASWLLRLVRHEGPADDPMPMPPQDNKLTDTDIATLTRWIATGALMPEPAAP